MQALQGRRTLSCMQQGGGIANRLAPQICIMQMLEGDGVSSSLLFSRPPRILVTRDEASYH